jgi:hypothetical protein
MARISGRFGAKRPANAGVWFFTAANPHKKARRQTPTGFDWLAISSA